MSTALITGASKGIGAATAIRMARNGWDIAVHYGKDEDGARAVVNACRAHGVVAEAIAAELGDESEINALFVAIDERLPTLGALVNNAGIVDLAARLDMFTAERLRRMFEINITAPFLCAREAVRRMSTSHGGVGGVIVNVSSTAARLGSPNAYIDYAASKAAIDVMTVGLAKEVAAEGIRVNSVRPGITNTGIHQWSGDADRVAKRGQEQPMGRAGEPEEVANAIAWLCSSEASYSSGSILDVGGAR